MKALIGVFAMALSAVMHAQDPALAAKAASSASSRPTAKVSDLNFLAGHWEGHVNDAKIEQTCSISDPTVMVCMFQLNGNKGTEMIEFYTIRDTPAGVQERVRFYSPDLEEEPGDGLTMKLASSSATTFVFENSNGNNPRRSTLTRTAPDEFHSHIELVDAHGKPNNIDAYWKKTK